MSLGAPDMRPSSGVAASTCSVLTIAFSLGGCGSSGTSLGTSSSDLTGSGAVAWTSVGYGINEATVGSGPNVLVVYGGYTATDADSEALSLQYVSAELGALGVGHVYAVRGPEDAEYAAREIGNSHLAAQLQAMVGSTGFVAIVAHSSGAFVADELFTEASAQVLSKIVYFDLDGGSWALTSALVGEMRGVYFCNARDPAAGDSANYSSIVSLHADFPASHYFTVDATGSGCNDGAVWCLHDTLITTRPHNHATYDLNDDYTDFTGAGRHVVTSQMQQAIAEGVLAASPAPVDAGTPPSGHDSGSDAGTGAPTTSCTLAGQTFATNTCTETLQCDDGAWVSRTSDPADCATGVEPSGACVTDDGAVVPQNTCTSTLQCDDGVWVDRESDPAACL
jgi:hypothetical protein